MPRRPAVTDHKRRLPAEAIAHLSEPLAPGAKYTNEQKETAFTVLALNRGNFKMACAELKEHHGWNLDRNTLSRWKKSEPERYERVRDVIVPRLYGHLADDFEAGVGEGTQAIRAMIADLMAKKDGLAPKDLAAAIRSVAVPVGIFFDKASAVRGRPSEVKAEASVLDLWKILERSGVVKNLPKIIEGSAVEEDT